jgi:hypothetical protein
MLAACIKMMQKHHKALLDGPCLYEFKQHLANLEPPQGYDYYTRNNQFREFQNKRKALADSHCNYGMVGCWQPAFDLKLTFVVHIKVPAFEKHSKWTIDEANRDMLGHMCKAGQKACV